MENTLIFYIELTKKTINNLKAVIPSNEYEEMQIKGQLISEQNKIIELENILAAYHKEQQLTDFVYGEVAQ